MNNNKLKKPLNTFLQKYLISDNNVDFDKKSKIFYEILNELVLRTIVFWYNETKNDFIGDKKEMQVYINSLNYLEKNLIKDKEWNFILNFNKENWRYSEENERLFELYREYEIFSYKNHFYNLFDSFIDWKLIDTKTNKLTKKEFTSLNWYTIELEDYYFSEYEDIEKNDDFWIFNPEASNNFVFRIYNNKEEFYVMIVLNYDSWEGLQYENGIHLLLKK